MSAHAAVTILRPRDDVERSWNDYIDGAEAAVDFKEAPGDRGTEVRLGGDEPLAKRKDTLRRFKQLVETGEIARSDASPEGELAERKLKQRPAQPLEDSEREKAGV